LFAFVETCAVLLRWLVLIRVGLVLLLFGLIFLFLEVENDENI
jgi:hypothetical protein